MRHPDFRLYWKVTVIRTVWYRHNTRNIDQIRKQDRSPAINPCTCTYDHLSSVQSLSRVWIFVTTLTLVCQASLSGQLLEPTQAHVHWVGDAIQPSHPLSSPLLLPSIFPSIRVFPNELAFHIRWPKYCSFSFSISLSNEYSGLISYRMDWLDLLPVQGTLKSLLQHHSSKAWILQHSAFFKVQLSPPYMTTGKTIALTGWNFVGKVRQSCL